jgi:CRISPR-associated protein Cas5t
MEVVSTMVDTSAEMVAVYVSVPVASFRLPHAREYLETSAVPPPSTVFGMLLSLVGEPNRLVHSGAEIAYALLSEPARSTVIRTAWRIKDAKIPPGLGSNRRPDFQEVLTDIRLAAFVRPGAGEQAPVPLAQRVAVALSNPASVRRFGGLSLGESTHLVDEVRRLRPGDGEAGRWLLSDLEGDLPQPIWPDHVGSSRTRWGQFSLADAAGPVDIGRVPDSAWVTIRPLD